METFGLATLEALACGTPVVVPAQGALREFVDTMLLFPASQVPRAGAGAVRAATSEAFADGVRTLLAVAPSLRRAAARSVARRYPWERTVSELLAVHASLVGTPTAA